MMKENRIYYNGLQFIEKEGKYYWSIEKYDEEHWQQIPEYLFNALQQFEGDCKYPAHNELFLIDSLWGLNSIEQKLTEVFQKHLEIDDIEKLISRALHEIRKLRYARDCFEKEIKNRDKFTLYTCGLKPSHFKRCEEEEK